MTQENMKIIKVTTEQFYTVPMHDENITQINGWPMEEVIKDWFHNPVHRTYHITRDSHHIMGADKVINTSVHKKEEIFGKE